MTSSARCWCDFRDMTCDDVIALFVVSEEYAELIEDIVRDGDLYSLYQHKEVLKVSQHHDLLYYYRQFPYSTASRGGVP